MTLLTSLPPSLSQPWLCSAKIRGTQPPLRMLDCRRQDSHHQKHLPLKMSDTGHQENYDKRHLPIELFEATSIELFEATYEDV